ncbi:MAG: hypothetical protein K2H09_02210, partial [Treponemataceae bacterium]|nr:hypothetical protein [Treponemataceae bacterium]
LLLSLRKYGKETLIICDVTRNASEDLLKMADDYLDYREIVAEDESDDDDDDEGKSGGAKAAKKAEPKMSKQQAFELFEEAVRMLGKTKNLPAPISTVKVRMKLLNAAFDERRLGFRNWKTFVGTAVKKTHVRYAGIDEANLTLDGTAAERKPEVFTALLTILPPASGGEDSGWIRFDEVAQKFDYRKFGYKKFKNLALDAETRDLIETKNNGNIWQMRQK